MTRNFLEMCRKDAGWPAIFKDVPQFSKGANGKKTWAMSQDDIALFVAAVRNRSEDEGTDKDVLVEKNSTLRDEKAAMSQDTARLQLQCATYEARLRVDRKAVSLGVSVPEAKQLGDTAAEAVGAAAKNMAS